MKKIIRCFFIATLLIEIISLSTCYSQNIDKKDNRTYSNIQLSAGYVPKDPFNALKANIMVNNLILKRIGFYTSFEQGRNNDFFKNIYGVSIGINKYAFLWGGLDIFSNSVVSGLRTNSNDIRRKEFGIGLNPYKWSAFTFGWSKNVGFTFTAGFHVPLKSKKRR